MADSVLSNICLGMLYKWYQVHMILMAFLLWFGIISCSASVENLSICGMSLGFGISADMLLKSFPYVMYFIEEECCKVFRLVVGLIVDSGIGFCLF